MTKQKKKKKKKKIHHCYKSHPTRLESEQLILYPRGLQQKEPQELNSNLSFSVSLRLKPETILMPDYNIRSIVFNENDLSHIHTAFVK